jgi:hypothetical protein
MRRVLLVVIAVFALGLPTTARADTCDGMTVLCGADSTGNGTYQGVVVIPGFQSGNAAQHSNGASGCADCEWSLVPACWVNSPENGADALCGAAVNVCRSRGDDGIFYWVFVRRPGEGWHQVGTACIGAHDPVVTLADLRVDAARYYRDEVRPNAATISPQPADGPWVVNLNAYFLAQGAAPLERTFGPAGARMTITATPTYVWDFGDESAPLETASVGGPYPDGDVTHVYRSDGRRTVTLTTRWSATFTVTTALGTFGPWDVPGAPIAPSTSRTIPVREARAELIGGG